MIRHTINGVEFWTPTEEETREAIASSLSHMQNTGWDLKEQASRMANLNGLYHADLRDDPRHPLHGRYSGLVAKNQAKAIGRMFWVDPADTKVDVFAPVEETDG